MGGARLRSGFGTPYASAISVESGSLELARTFSQKVLLDSRSGFCVRSWLFTRYGTGGQSLIRGLFLTSCFAHGMVLVGASSGSTIC